MNTRNTPPTQFNRFLIAAAASTLFASSWAETTQSSLDSKTITLQVRVFLAKSEITEKLNCTMSEKALSECFTIVNENWAPANIHWSIESVREFSIQPDAARRYQTSLEANPRRANMKILVDSFPNDQRLKDGFNVLIIESMGNSAGGVFRPRPYGDVFYAHQSPRGYAVPAILAHELGHALGLPHTVFEKNNNLMMGAGPGRKPTRVKPLTASQIKLARAQAKKGKPFKPQTYQYPAPQGQAFSILDSDGDGMLTVAENEETRQDLVRDLLRRASRAPEESLTQDEYILVQSRRQRGPRRERSRGQRVGPSVATLINEGDKNRDGMLSREEADGYIPSGNFNLSDRDNDGYITAEDIIATRKGFGINAEGFRIPRRP